MLICGKYFEHFWLGEYLQVCVKTNKNNKRMRNVTVTKNSHRIHLAPYIYTYKATDTQQNNAKKSPCGNLLTVMRMHLACAGCANGVWRVRSRTKTFQPIFCCFFVIILFSRTIHATINTNLPNNSNQQFRLNDRCTFGKHISKSHLLCYGPCRFIECACFVCQLAISMYQEKNSLICSMTAWRNCL